MIRYINMINDFVLENPNLKLNVGDELRFYDNNRDKYMTYTLMEINIQKQSDQLRIQPKFSNYNFTINFPKNYNPNKVSAYKRIS